MTILTLSGNFQPPSVDSGKPLPLPSARAPSTNKTPVLREVESVPTNQNEIISNSVKDTTLKSEKQTEAEVSDQIEALQQFNQSIDRTLQFKVDEELGVTIVRVVDKETDELIRQFPPEELINLSRRLKELNEQEASSIGLNNSPGILLQEKV